MKIEEQIRRAICTQHLSPRTEKAYVRVYKAFVRYHELKHPAEMSEREVGEFLSYLANERHVSASSQNVALSALLFLYKHIIGKPLGMINGVVRAKHERRLPVVLTREETVRVLACAPHDSRGLILRLLYGTAARRRVCSMTALADALTAAACREVIVDPLARAKRQRIRASTRTDARQSAITSPREIYGTWRRSSITHEHTSHQK